MEAAKKALPAWQDLTVKARAAIMFRFHHLLQAHADELADLVRGVARKAESGAVLASPRRPPRLTATAPAPPPGRRW